MRQPSDFQSQVKTMDENLLGYLLNALDPAEHREVAAYLENNSEARQRLEQLRQALVPLEADRGDLEPPPDLVIRTLGHVAEYCCRDLPHAPQAAARAAGSNRALWRRADVLTAASILLLIAGLGLPWLLRLREDQALAACKNNLRLFHEALMTYAVRHDNRFPDVNTSAPPPRNVAGLVVPILNSDGDLPSNTTLRCPGSAGGCGQCALTLQKILDMSDEEFTQQVHQMVSCYAYSLGYRDGNGVYHGPCLDPEQQTYLPIMADRPPDDPTAGNSFNHGANRGQNVLYMDGHVRFCTERTVGVNGDDIFLNKARQVGAGLDCYDTVLGGGTARP